uniref:LigA protein n=1 Tax=Streptomyces sp. NBC_00003 TaxID=2903608 RepID=A0AAU2V961_9ACTN
MPFEDRLGEAMRHTGDSFELGDRRGLVESGLVRGRRRLARRRTAAVTGSVLALATVGFGGAYAAGLVGGEGGGSSVAAPPKPSPTDGPIGGEKKVALFKSLLPPGTVTEEQGSGPGDPEASGKPGASDKPGGSSKASVSGVFDDGNGPGLVALGVSRVDPAAESSREQVACPAKAFVDYDSCQTEQRADGSRYMLLQGYEYPDRREATKNWRAVLLTPKGILVDASEWNAPAEKGARVSRDTPPLTAGQLKALVISPKWLSVADALRAPQKADKSVGRGPGSGPSAEAVQKQLIALLPAGKGLKVGEKGGQDGYAFVVVDDGKGKSLVQINVQSGMSDVSPEGTTSTLPDGTVVGLAKKPGEKSGAGVVMWIADTVRPDGFRVVISAFNTGNQNKAATRAEPALTLNELKAIALDPRWATLK